MTMSAQVILNGACAPASGTTDFTHGEQGHPRFGEHVPAQFERGDVTAAELPARCAAPRAPSQWLDENRQLGNSLS